ncbi:MAG: AmmeMemoRadiSam system protein B [Deltaproteobacteria bacterium]|nr:AmmeMemoRadiSam system protein B [Deltaproteobacteria bacterium]MBW2218083.1 AmmeMemoRadiSam system protein B [Deltaproteobacteria bacterium]
MKKPVYLFIIVLFFFTSCLCFVGAAFADAVRKPVWKGKFYPALPSELSKTIKRLTDRAKQTEFEVPANTELRAIILPHAGYAYSGLTAAHASLVLKKKQFSKVIVAGPDHRIGFVNAAVSNASIWETPLGQINIHKDARKLLGMPDIFRHIPASDNQEHSVEVILPLLQYYIGNFDLVPIVVGSKFDINRITNAIDSLIDRKTLFVASCDLSHYLSYEDACLKDKKTIGMILNREEDQLLNSYNVACGVSPVVILLKLADRYGWQPVLLHYSNSGDTAGGHDRVVGYTTIAFYGDVSMKKKNASPASKKRFTKKQGETLIKLARQTIMERFGDNFSKQDIDMMTEALSDKKLKNNHATFVTINKKNQLRGCIGSLTAIEPLTDSIKRNAISAAFHDHRFSPLLAEEVGEIEIEVSILTEPQPLEYTDAEDLIKKLRPKEDGVILQKGSARATFLPQVWDQLPEHEEFLSRLCSKAGMPPDAWQTIKLDVFTYQVQYFEEKK